MRILLISDIHANFPALQAVSHFFRNWTFDCIINSGDSVVYAPFPNETLGWLRTKNAHSILGNTDKKVITLLKGKSFRKPSKHEKRIMYLWTAENLTQENSNYLQSCKKKLSLTLPADNIPGSRQYKIGVFHGSPARHHEFLFDTTSNSRFLKLAGLTKAEIVVCGHSHVPFYKFIGNTHFINPGSIGRMFDGDPRTSCAVLQLTDKKISVKHYRVAYDIEQTIAGLRENSLPEIYENMFLSGRKTN